VREALHQWSTNSFRGAEGLTPRLAPLTEAEEAAAAEELDRLALSPMRGMMSARKTSGRVGQSPSVYS
jgi:hypothetical protein